MYRGIFLAVGCEVLAAMGCTKQSAPTVAGSPSTPAGPVAPRAVHFTDYDKGTLTTRAFSASQRSKVHDYAMRGLERTGWTPLGTFVPELQVLGQDYNLTLHERFVLFYDNRALKERSWRVTDEDEAMRSWLMGILSREGPRDPTYEESYFGSFELK